MSAQQDNHAVDKVGIWASSACAVHCLLLPVLLPLLPAIGGMFFAQVWFERSILSLSMLVGLWALLRGFSRYHRQLYPLVPLLVGGAIYWHKDILGESYEPFTIALGAGLIIGAHVANIRLSRNKQLCERNCHRQRASS